MKRDLPLKFRNPQSAIRILFVLAAPPLAAQTASPYIPADYWGAPYLEHFIAAGEMVDPTPLTRPLKVDQVVSALQGMDSTTVTGGQWRVARAILNDLRRPEQGPYGRIDGDIGVAAATYSERDPLELGRGVPNHGYGSKRGFAAAGLDMQLDFGPVVLVTHPVADTRLKFDPDWFGKKDRAVAGRTAESYIDAQWHYGELFFGRLDRNWGPSVVQGLLLSPDPYGLDHLGLTLGTSGIQLQAMVTQLDTRLDSLGTSERRFMVQHRLWIHPPGAWTVSLWEGNVWAGADRGLEPWFLNVMNLGFLEQVNTNTNVNSLLGADFEVHGRITAFGQVLLDDIQVDKKSATDKKPTSWGLTLGAKGALGAGGAASWTAFYTQVANLTYRNEDNLQIPLYHGLGTGRNFSDYDQATLQFAWIAPGGVLVEPEFTLLRQGEGDPRLPHPAPIDYPNTSALFQGIVQRTWRAALGLRWQEGPIHFNANGGVHYNQNDGHVDGQTKTRFVGTVALSWRFHTGGRLP
ncbi:MAG TPA: hypothetical protein VKB45_09365 [Gemmatimonadales bacterium]|nr:hypothetical protein [Gemmatimonadales bacterium]